MAAAAFLPFCAFLLLVGDTGLSSQELCIRSSIDEIVVSESARRFDSSDRRFPILKPKTPEHAVDVFSVNWISHRRSGPSVDRVPRIGNTRLLLRTVEDCHRKMGSRIDRRTALMLPDDANGDELVFVVLRVGYEMAAFDSLSLRLEEFSARNQELHHNSFDQISDSRVGVLCDKIRRSLSWTFLPERLHRDEIRSSKQSHLIKQEQIDGFWTDPIPESISLQLQDGTDPLTCSNVRLPGYSKLKKTPAVYLCKRDTTLKSAIKFFRSHPDFFLNAAFLFWLVAVTASALYVSMD